MTDRRIPGSLINGTAGSAELDAELAVVLTEKKGPVTSSTAGGQLVDLTNGWAELGYRIAERVAGRGLAGSVELDGHPEVRFIRDLTLTEAVDQPIDEFRVVRRSQPAGPLAD